MKLFAVLWVMMIVACRTGEAPVSTAKEVEPVPAANKVEPVPTSNTNVQSATFDAAKQSLVLKVQYGGGCKDHVFQLKLVRCLETSPVQCSAVLIDKTEDDFCKMIKVEDVILSLKDLGWNTAYYSKASVSIQSTSGAKLSIALPALPL